ncbi:MAG: VTT domain-containing protein, partial [candidate division WOR-3 bacterium]|nr:VTT domain-containing protein [candidate division WOR-3 bacterium]
FDNYIVRKGPFIIFLLLLIPFSPLGDVIYYLSGLTAIPFGFFLLMVIIARLPSNFVYSLLGAKAFSFTVREWLIFLVVLIILTLLFYRNRRRIERLILKFVKLG